MRQMLLSERYRGQADRSGGNRMFPERIRGACPGGCRSGDHVVENRYAGDPATDDQEDIR